MSWSDERHFFFLSDKYCTRTKRTKISKQTPIYNGLNQQVVFFAKKEKKITSVKQQTINSNQKITVIIIIIIIKRLKDQQTKQTNKIKYKAKTT